MGIMTGYKAYLLQMLKRPEWLGLSDGVIPNPPFTFMEPTADESDVALCERLISAYSKAVTENGDTLEPGTIWSGIIERFGSPLTAALHEGDPRKLAELLAGMFQSEIVRGMATGAEYPDALTSEGQRVWSMKLIDDLLSLAESLGVVRAEDPEQGVLGYALRNGLGEVFEEIEGALGLPIGFPAVGAPYGVKVGDRLITMESPEHIYVASRIAKLGCYGCNVVEIGAGFGGLAYWLLKMNIADSYTILDLPFANVLQGYFLSKALGDSHVSLYADNYDGTAIVRILPPQELHLLCGHKTDVLINENSMPEMPESTVRGYLEWAKKNVKGIFYSYNQEAFAPVNGVPQVLVPKIVSEVGGFKLLNRNPSWVRRGYVECVYEVNN